MNELGREELEEGENISSEVPEMSENSEDDSDEEETLESSGQVDEEKKEENYREKYYYLAAEMENMRKRHQRERENLLKYGNEKVLTGLLEVVDNLDRTLESLSEEDRKDGKVDNIAVGVEMVQRQFLGVLRENGLKSVEAEGLLFDPHLHEAVAQQKAEGKGEREILRVCQKGYILNGRLLRAAKVIVAAEND